MTNKIPAVRKSEGDVDPKSQIKAAKSLDIYIYQIIINKGVEILLHAGVVYKNRGGIG